MTNHIVGLKTAADRAKSSRKYNPQADIKRRMSNFETTDLENDYFSNPNFKLWI
jgi:hypothetical protein